MAHPELGRVVLDRMMNEVADVGKVESSPMMEARAMTMVLARELGIPAVVGAHGALGIPDGALVDVDPVPGTVRVV